MANKQILLDFDSFVFLKGTEFLLINLAPNYNYSDCNANECAIKKCVFCATNCHMARMNDLIAKCMNVYYYLLLLFQL